MSTKNNKENIADGIKDIEDVRDVLSHDSLSQSDDLETDRLERIRRLLIGNLAYIFNIPAKIINFKSYEEYKNACLQSGVRFDDKISEMSYIARRFGIHVLKNLGVRDDSVDTILGLSYKSNKRYYDDSVKNLIAGETPIKKRIQRTADIVIAGIRNEIVSTGLAGPAVQANLDGPEGPSVSMGGGM